VQDRLQPQLERMLRFFPYTQNYGSKILKKSLGVTAAVDLAWSRSFYESAESPLTAHAIWKSNS